LVNYLSFNLSLGEMADEIKKKLLVNFSSKIFVSLKKFSQPLAPVLSFYGLLIYKLFLYFTTSFIK